MDDPTPSPVSMVIDGFTVSVATAFLCFFFSFFPFFFFFFFWSFSRPSLREYNSSDRIFHRLCNSFTFSKIMKVYLGVLFQTRFQKYLIYVTTK